MEKEPARAASLTLADVALQKRQAAMAQNEAKYQALQQAIMEQLGVKPEEVTGEMPVGLSMGAGGEKKPSLTIGGSAASDDPESAFPAAGGPASPAVGGAPSPSAKGAVKTGAPGKTLSPSATQQQQGRKK